MSVSLVRPSEAYKESYINCVMSGFKNMQLGHGDVEADAISDNPQKYFLDLLDKTPFVFTTPDDHKFNVSEHEILWAVDAGEFIGSLAMRYQSDLELEENFCGHVGIAISTLHQRKGYGFKALKLALSVFQERGFSEIFYTANPENTASIKLVEKIGGTYVRNVKPDYGLNSVLLYKITL